MRDLEEIKKLMKFRTLGKISEEIGWPAWKIRHALHSKDPKYYPLKALSDFLDKETEGADEVS